MMIVTLLGGRKDLLYKPLVNMLASSGYRVAAAVQLRKVGLAKEVRDLAEAGAGLIMVHTTNRALLSTTYVPHTLEEVKRTVSCLAPVDPDVLILLGFRKLAGRDEGVLKALAVWSAKEAKSLLSELSPPVVGVYSDRGDYEGGYKSPEELAKAIIEEGMRRRLIPPRVYRP